MHNHSLGFLTLFSIVVRTTTQKSSKDKEVWIIVNHLDFIPFVGHSPYQLQNSHSFLRDMGHRLSSERS